MRSGFINWAAGEKRKANRRNIKVIVSSHVSFNGILFTSERRSAGGGGFWRRRAREVSKATESAPKQMFLCFFIVCVRRFACIFNPIRLHEIDISLDFLSSSLVPARPATLALHFNFISHFASRIARTLLRLRLPDRRSLICSHLSVSRRRRGAQRRNCRAGGRVSART